MAYSVLLSFVAPGYSVSWLVVLCSFEVLMQGVVTFIPTVVTLATGIKNFDRQNFALIT